MVKVSQPTGPDAHDDSAQSAHTPDKTQIAGIDQLSYEEARSQLVEIVTQLEQGSLPLEDSLALWERGEALARKCQEWLDGARSRLEAVTEPTPSAADKAATEEDQ
ncbi:MAG: exodeoxyribonuclease VII small subunit [Ancrocorticia sp.]|uniref:exodeoxyribonuclease VII small subunit n=1 Tax=Ancrocorticia sp. TaxID=2593684 RepID=UPI003F927C54